MPDVTPPDPRVLAAPELSDDDIRAFEAMAARAWPARERVAQDGWVLRASPAPPRRVNSVFTQAWHDGASVVDRIAAAEAFYRGHGKPPRFQITRASLPAGLDDLLARHGYAVEAPVDVQIAPADGLRLDGADAAGGEIEMLPAPDDRWFAVYAAGFGRDVRAVVDAIAGRAVYPVFRRAGETLAVGLGVMEDGWLGIFGMQTREDQRGRGIGRALLRALTDCALANGAGGLYLQVEQHNPRARALYERAGFRTAYGYHYRTLG